MSRTSRIVTLIAVLCLLMSQTIVSAAKPLTEQDAIKMVQTHFKAVYQRMAPNSQADVTISPNQDEAYIVFEVVPATDTKANVTYNHLVMFHVTKNQIDQAAEYERTSDGVAVLNLLDHKRSTLKEGKDVPALKSLPQPPAPKEEPESDTATTMVVGETCQYCTHYTEVPGHWETSWATVWGPVGCSMTGNPLGAAICTATVVTITSWVPGYTYCDTVSTGFCYQP